MKHTLKQIDRDIKVIAFDADDTLWDNEPFFRENEDELCEILRPYGTKEEISTQLFEIEMANMPDYGYGAVAFTMSLIESAIKSSNSEISAKEIARIIESGRKLVRIQATPLPGVTKTLKKLQESQKYKLVVYTKGELLTQENKLKRSGLLPYFAKTYIVTNKQEEDYRKLCLDLQIAPHELLMIGNSLKSDILPALNIGASAIYIPYAIMWQHEIIEKFEHEHMIQIEKFEQLCELLTC